ncbi:MAG TPA: Clp protease N-terminal domain-containing protein [Vicinamibacterales bacterium]|jgi:quinol monooxygenase YgiN|nr:Clp protease N-terminal domain-containing protein [Vicinamibacterales bacterium]
MFERYTERARRVLFFARYEASQLGSPAIDTEHLLLGLLRDGKGLTARIFDRAHLDPMAVHMEVYDAAADRPRIATSVEIPIARQTKAVLAHAAEEADRLLDNYIGAEHMLLGLLRHPESVAGAILARAGLHFDSVRESIVRFPAGKPGERHVVLVQVTIKPEMQPEFEAALLHNASESVLHDPGCLRFDVSQDKEHPEKWVLYEVYDSPDAHAAHRQSPHFLAYDAVAARAVVEKSVAKCASRHVT